MLRHASNSIGIKFTDASIRSQLQADSFMLIGPVFLDHGIMRNQDLKNDDFILHTAQYTQLNYVDAGTRST